MSVFVFGYGSLMHPKDARRTVTPSTEKPVVLQGYRRVWTDNWDGFTFLNVEECEDCACNGILIEMSQDQLESLDQRENTYNRIVKKIDGKEVWVYISKYPNKSTKDSPVLQSYVDVFLSGALLLGEDFFDRCVQSTDWEMVFKNDRIMPKYRPHNPELHEKIDAFLKTRAQITFLDEK